ncbi:MAG: hypothetical protein WCI73_10920 [Phycisphaerae bacterium]
MRKIFAAAVVGLLVGTGSVWAADAVPATAPTTAPASQPAVVIDRSTPKGAMLALFASMKAGDAAATLRDCFVFENADDKKGIESMLQPVFDMTNLSKAASAQFGAAAQEVFPNPTNNVDREAKMVDELDFVVTGDKATATPREPGGETTTAPATTAPAKHKSEGPEFSLTRVGKDWKIEAKSLLQGAGDPVQRKRRDQFMAAMHSGTEALIAEIKASKYATADEAMQAFGNKQREAFQAVMRAAQPATAPAGPAGPAAPTTAPATGPATQP